MTSAGAGADLTADAEPTYGVGELARAINSALGREFGAGIWVRGEIQNWSARGPHAYFQLVEDIDGQRAVIEVKLFADVRRRITPILTHSRLSLDDGLAVRIFGVPDFWAPNGRLGFKMRDIDPRFTLGDLAMAREDVLRRLRASGRFDTNRELTLSPVPLRIGLVTSEGTAAWHDFVQQLTESGLGFHLAVHHSAVQGDGAEHHIAAAIGRLATLDLDAIVVIRGGGSRNDLAAFDAEVIAQAILASPIPVLTGIGHETDRSIADEVAHTALKTPTACAAMLIERVRASMSQMEHAWQQIAEIGRRRLAQADRRVGDLAHQIASHTRTAVERADLRLGHRHQTMAARTTHALGAERATIERFGQRLTGVAAQSLRQVDQQLALADARIAAHDPARLLGRGWSITTDETGAVVRSVSQVAVGAELRTRLVDGLVLSTVDDRRGTDD
jgi:exodeoxyribonuclease VII large subunit